MCCGGLTFSAHDYTHFVYTPQTGVLQEREDSCCGCGLYVHAGSPTTLNLDGTLISPIGYIVLRPIYLCVDYVCGSAMDEDISSSNCCGMVVPGASQWTLYDDGTIGSRSLRDKVIGFKVTENQGVRPALVPRTDLRHRCVFEDVLALSANYEAFLARNAPK